MTIPIDESGFSARRGWPGLFGAGAFFTAQLGALSSSRKLNSLRSAEADKSAAFDAREKLQIFARVSDEKMSEDKSLFGAPVVQAALKAGKKKTCFAASVIDLAHEALTATRDLAEAAGTSRHQSVSYLRQLAWSCAGGRIARPRL